MLQKAAIYPSKDAFAATHNQGKTQVVWSKLVADVETPVSAMLKLTEAGQPCFLLESVHGGEIRGRYSILGFAPDRMWRFNGNKAEIAPWKNGECGKYTPCSEPTLESLRTLLAESHIEIPDELPPMAAGLVGYMNYDAVRLAEKIPDNNPDTINVPDGLFMRPTLLAIFDNVAGMIYIICPIWKEHLQIDTDEAYGNAVGQIEVMLSRLQQSLNPEHVYRDQETMPLPCTSNVTKDQYCTMVDKAKEYIAAGDIFQVVLSQRFSIPFELPHFALYRALRHLNPSPFLFYLHFGEFSLVGSSPEILVRLRNGTVTMRPIAGTRKRGENMQQDEALAQDLLADPKELAEHLMLLDLGRNDVGRVSKTGTVKVTEKMKIERYSHVMHIVSNVEGELADEYDAVDALMAGFPAGTVSGAPKIRAMEIIDELEPERRSFYAGCSGYFSANGAMDTCISLRTGLIKDGMLYVQAGGGVVADSTGEGEYEESCNKAKALIKAAEQAVKFQ
ncbi:MAG: anthranilate synthase component I [Alphaproteobacteria bacterium]|nr:anthranilate synthase component I [Alphaproteobacteria bacterium]